MEPQSNSCIEPCRIYWNHEGFARGAQRLMRYVRVCKVEDSLRNLSFYDLRLPLRKFQLRGVLLNLACRKLIVRRT